MATSLEFGANGSILKGAGSLTSGPYVIVKALEDSSVTVVSNWVGASNPESVTIPAFGTIEGVFTTITWVSGKVVAYK
jgi:hypothetical protein